MRVVEYTGGSTGSSLAMVCAIKGYAFHPLSSDAFAKEKLDTMRAFGADLEIVASDGGKVTPALFDKFKARIAELLKDPNTFWTDQFNNADALDGYANIGRELVEQVGQVDAYRRRGRHRRHAHRRVARAEGGRQRRAYRRARAAHVAVPDDGQGGAHRVEGTAAGFWPPHLTKDMYDEARAIDENDGRAMARRVAKEEGIFAGTSSGVNLVAALNARARAGSRQGRRDGRSRYRPEVPRRRSLQIDYATQISLSTRWKLPPITFSITSVECLRWRMPRTTPSIRRG